VKLLLWINGEGLHVQQITQPVSSDIFLKFNSWEIIGSWFRFRNLSPILAHGSSEYWNESAKLIIFFWKWGYRISIYSHFPFGSRIVAWTLHVPVPIQLETYCISYLFILPCYACSSVALEKFAAVRKLDTICFISVVMALLFSSPGNFPHQTFDALHNSNLSFRKTHRRQGNLSIEISINIKWSIWKFV